jgi:hypothetical protein
MKNADAWVKILYTYGPFAILVFLVFVTERKSRTAMKEAAPSKEKLLTGIYAFNWLIIFGVVIYSVIAWKQINIDRPPEIRGMIENISNSEVLSSNVADLYLHRVRQDNDLYSNYEWLLVNREKREDGEAIVFTIDGSKPESEKIFDYELPIRPDFYAGKVYIRRDKDDLYLRDQAQPLPKRKKIIGSPPTTTPTTTTKLRQFLEFFTTTAYAQTAQAAFSVSDFAIGLESPDAIVRRKTREDLANFDQATALSWIDDVLQDQTRSYRLKLGVLVALNNMPNLRRESLKPATIAAIQSAVGAPDPSLRSEALSLARRYDLVPVTIWEHVEFSGKFQGFGPGRYGANKGQLYDLPNDSASSLRVAEGFKVRLCENEGDGSGSGKCQTFGAGWHAVKSSQAGGVADLVSFIEVTKSK